MIRDRHPVAAVAATITDPLNRLVGATSGGGSAAWGAITGTLSAQTDLQSALNAKQASLGFTPYNATNPAGYISSITSGNVTTALGFTPYNATNPAGYISGITSGNVTTALGYTPTSVTGLTGTQSVAAFKTGLSLVKGDVGLGSVDNTADAAKAVLTATKLVTARSLTVSGDLAWTVSFDGSAAATAAGTLATVNSNTGTFGGAATVAQISVNGKGLITAVTAVGIAAPWGALTGVPAAVTALSGTNTGDQSLAAYATLASPAFTGTITGVTQDFSGTVKSGGVDGFRVYNSNPYISFWDPTQTTRYAFIQSGNGALTVSNSVSGAAIMLTTNAGNVTITGTVSTTGALTYGGVTLANSVTGTGNMVLSASPQFTGVSYYQQGAPTAKTATGTLTIAELLTLIITSTSATAVSLTLPTGTLTDAGILAGALAVNEAFEWYVINLGSSTGACTLVAGTAHTIVGSAVTAIATSSRWLTRKTATNTYTTYRIA